MTLAILGLGAMGQRMAARAVQAGIDVVTWNRTPRSIDGARSADSPRHAAAEADVVLTMLRDVDAARDVWLGPTHGALQGLRAGALAVESSTVTPAWSSELQQAVSEAGGRFLEAPVVGTRPHAEQGTLTVLVGGSPEDLATAQPAFESWGKAVHVGPVGAAMALKLAINSLFAGQVVLLAEALTLLTQFGIDQDQGLAMLEPTPVFAPVLTGIAGLLRAGKDEPLFPVDLVHKDLGYAADQAALPLFEAVQARYAAASEAGLGGRNLHAVAKLY